MGLGEGGRKRAAAMWYLVGLPSYKNLRDRLKELMARKQKVLPEVEESSSDGIPLRARGQRQGSAQPEVPKPEEPEKHWRSISKEPRQASAGQTSQTSAQSGSQVSHANRSARYEAVRALYQRAISQREIARRLNLSRQTVHRFLSADSFPERSRPPYRGSILDPYKPYVLERWKAGCWNGSQLYSEVKELGYTGSEALFRLFIASLRKQHQAAGTSTALTLDVDGAKVSGPINPLQSPLSHLECPQHEPPGFTSVSQSSLTRSNASRSRKSAAQGDLDIAYDLAQAFVSMLAEHRDTNLDEWLAQAEHSGIPELKSFACGIRAITPPCAPLSLQSGAMVPLKRRSTA